MWVRAWTLRRGMLAKPERLDPENERMVSELPARELREREMAIVKRRLQGITEVLRGAA
jgi:hypothetical protein